ncbi:hypothetical protein VOLCADRAFT_96322 [Volvox carteri f. nagariensis]|uniref:Uncharacterized protein n=1 Tax=Volvox carteri f. nagariensis TaxID=3068 RepID=D8U9T3_VOLCA|nr:uncharacterized protein VOLCADRAFT_96322 [Volvox carteri f. nagariensis]EFJ43526.1 hypothetical protein VOLCADRAFT_96322 [Volvox carteri f. nagariensis]|eukprot:XP_002955455.1 hypothetical protein VOLCADRAFT_96322 [Volvox carteri f. nagariensis]
MTAGLPSTEMAISSPVSLILGLQMQACGDDYDPNSLQHGLQQPAAAEDAVCDLILDMDAAAAAVSAALTGIPGGPPVQTRKNGPGDAAGTLGVRHCGAVHPPPPPPPPPPRRSFSHHTTTTIATAAGALFGVHPKAGALYPFSFLQQHQAPPPPPPPRQYLRTLSQSSQPYHLSPASLPTPASGRVTTRIANVVGVGATGCHMGALAPPSAQGQIAAGVNATAVAVGASSVLGESPEAAQYPSLSTAELPPRWRFSISGPTADLGRDFTAPQRPMVRWHASSSGLATDLPPYQYDCQPYGFQQPVVSPSYLQGPSVPSPQQHPFQGQAQPMLIPGTSQAQLQHLQPQPIRQARSGPLIAAQQQQQRHHHLQQQQQQQQQLDRATANRLIALSQLQQQLGVQSATARQPTTAAAAAAAVGSTLTPLSQSLQVNMLAHPHCSLLPQAAVQTSTPLHSPFVGGVLGLTELGFDVCTGVDPGTRNAAGGVGSRVQAAAGGRLQAIMQDDPIALVRLYERSLTAAMADAQCGRGPVSMQQLHHEHELLQGVAGLLAANTSAAAMAAQTAASGSGEAEGCPDIDIDMELAMLLVSARRHTAEWPSLSEPYKYGIMITARALSLGLLDAAGKGQALNERLYGAVQPLLYTLAEKDESFLGMLRAAMPPPSAAEGTATTGSTSAATAAEGDATSADDSVASAPAAASPKLARWLLETLCTIGGSAVGAAAGSDPVTAPAAAPARDWSWRARVPGGPCESDCDTVLGSSSGGAAGATRPSSQGEVEHSEDDPGMTGLAAGGCAAVAATRAVPLQPEAAGQDRAAGGGGGGANSDPQRFLGRSSSAPANREARGRLLSSLFSSFNNSTARANAAAGSGGFGGPSGALDAGSLAQLLDDDPDLLGAAAAAAALGGWHAGGGSDSGGGALDSTASSSVLASFLESFGAASRSSMALSPLLDGCSSGSLDMSSLSLSIHPSPRTSPANPLAMRRELAAAVAAGAEINSAGAAAAAVAQPSSSAAGPPAPNSSAQSLLAAPRQGPPGAAGLVQVQLSPHSAEFGSAVAAAAAAMAAAAATGPAIGGLAGSPYDHHAAGALLGALEARGDLDGLSWDPEAIQTALRILQATAQLDG